MRIRRGQIGLILLVLIDIVLVSFAFYAAFWLRNEGSIPPKEIKLYFNYLPLVVISYIVFFAFLGLYNKIWDFVGLKTLRTIFYTVILGTGIISLYIFFVKRSYYSRSIIIIGGILVFLLTGISRFSWRILREIIYPILKRNKEKIRILIVGAGSAGVSLCRSIIRDDFNFELIGFIDDDKVKLGKDIQGFKVFGLVKDIPKVVNKFQIAKVIIAIPSATGDKISQIYKICHQIKVPVSLVPPLPELLDKKISISQIRNIQPEDILGREIIKLDTTKIAKHLQSKCILVTGAAGSIGSELSRQIAGYDVKELLLIDKEETALYELSVKMEKFMKEQGCTRKLNFYLNDIRNKKDIERIFNEKRPDIIFHAAAYKHVPVLEKEIVGGVLNNIEATVQLAEIAMAFKSKQFVYISTDKAVNPTSIMGTTKRIGELFIKSLGYQNITDFISVRFGNVFGSRGSLIPILEKQIKEGGPVTITHPECLRYFMTIPEAVQLILNASALGENGKLYILDMGNPLKIEDIAKKLIEFYSNGGPEEKVNMEYIGLRPGEKLVEELHYKYEKLERINNSKLFLVADGTINIEKDELIKGINELINQAKLYNRDSVIKKLQELVPEYKSPFSQNV